MTAITQRTQQTCEWTQWIDRDNPTATGDWEDKIAPPYPGIPVGPGSKCEYTEYQVRLKGESQVYTDVSRWLLFEFAYPLAIVFCNIEFNQT